jgi:DNA-binding NarL/FixJ family response regulator
MSKTRIVVADDHKIVREGLARLIHEQSDMKVVGEAGDGEEALRVARQLKPDVVIMDLAMPGMNGLKATQAIQAEMPQIKILILTSYEDQSYFRESCQANAVGYVLKRAAGQELLHAIRRVAAGHRYFDEELAAQALSRSIGGPNTPESPSAAHLSAREEEVLRGVAFGFTNKELANSLGLSVRTVETHKVRICEKLGLRSRADMVRYAIRQGWLDQVRSLADLPCGKQASAPGVTRSTGNGFESNRGISRKTGLPPFAAEGTAPP